MKQDRNNKVSWSVYKLIVNGQVFSAKDDFQNIIPETDIDDTIDVMHTEHLSDSGSTFIGHAAEITRSESVAAVLANILQDRIFATATHNIYAYRIGRTTNIKEECRDDGEHGSWLAAPSNAQGQKCNQHNGCCIKVLRGNTHGSPAL